MNHNSQEQPAATSPVTQHSSNAVRAKVRRIVNTFVCAGQASGDTLDLGVVPAGARGINHRVTVSATLGTSTLAIGISGTAAKYAAAATYTTADSPVTKAKAANLEAELAADEQQYATIGVAALPNDGTVIAIETFFTLTD